MYHRYYLKLGWDFIIKLKNSKFGNVYVKFKKLWNQIFIRKYCVVRPEISYFILFIADQI